MDFDLDPAWHVQWTTDLRYVLGVRASRRDPALASSPFFDEGDYVADQGGIVTDRVDINSGVNVKYKPSGVDWLDSTGVRVSGQAFHDFVYSGKTDPCNSGILVPPGTPGFRPSGYTYCDGQVTSYSGGQRNSAFRVIEYQRVEALDRFGFVNLRFGDVPVSIRAGAYALFWGESLFNPFLGVSYSMGPLDLNKGTTVPGSTAQDVFLPLNQISGSIGLLRQLSLGFDVPLEWRGPRAPEGGSFLQFAGPFFDAPGQLFHGFALTPAGEVPIDLVHSAPVHGNNSGNFGLQLRWSPDFMAGGSLAVYYRKFDEMLPWTNSTGPDAGSPFGYYRYVYPKGTELYGLSASRTFGGMSFSGELAYSHNRGLNSLELFPSASGQGARGDTLSAVFDGIILGHQVKVFGIPLVDEYTITAEAYGSYLQKITSNPTLTVVTVNPATGQPIPAVQGASPVTVQEGPGILAPGETFTAFEGVGSPACRYLSQGAGNSPLNSTGTQYPAGSKDGCSDRKSFGVAAQVILNWFQVLPDIDFSATGYYNVGISGTSPIIFGGYEGNANGSLGLTAVWRQNFSANLGYNYYYAPFKVGAPGTPAAGTPTTFAGLGIQNDRNWWNLTLKYSF
jgi:hypothetical protein